MTWIRYCGVSLNPSNSAAYLQSADGILFGGDVELKTNLRDGFQRDFDGSLTTADAAHRASRGALAHLTRGGEPNVPSQLKREKFEVIRGEGG